jgi:hypothetical protein
MKRTLWMTTVAFVLGALWLLTGVAWAQPSGPANVPQILNVRTFKGAFGDEQRTFLTTDFITFEATYYDPNPDCVGESPVLLQLLLFNLEGQLLFTFDGDSQDSGSGYRLLFTDLSSGGLPAGNYQHVFLVRDCTDVNIFVSGFQTIRVLAP